MPRSISKVFCLCGTVKSHKGLDQFLNEIWAQVVSLVTAWLRCSPSLCDPSSPSLPVTGTSPVSSLLAWPVLAPLIGRCNSLESTASDKSIFFPQRGRRSSPTSPHPGRNHIGWVGPMSGTEYLKLQGLNFPFQCLQVPGQYLTHLARSLHSRLSEGNHSEQAQGLALDRWTSFQFAGLIKWLLFCWSTTLSGLVKFWGQPRGEAVVYDQTRSWLRWSEICQEIDCSQSFSLHTASLKFAFWMQCFPVITSERGYTLQP